MIEKVAKRLNDLVPSGIRKVNEKALVMEREGKSVVHLELGRPDFDTPEYIKKSAIKSLNEGRVFYTSNYGTPELRNAIANKLQKENNVDYKAEEILVSVGLSEAIYDVMSVLLEEGDEILIPDPVWMNYLNIPKLLGAVPVSYNLLEENDYQLDLAEIEKKVTPKTKAIVIISPNNPTGSVLSKEILMGLADIVKRNNLIVMADEVYERIIFDGNEHISIASLPGMKERTITFNGFSKAYSMTGWRLGYVAAPKEMIVNINKIHQIVTTCATTFCQDAAVTALTEETNEVKNMVEEYQKRRDYLVKEINQIEGMSCRCPKGAFYIFVNVKELGIPCEELADYLLKEAQVALVPGTVFGDNGEGYIRLSYANSMENLRIAVANIRQAVEKLKNR